MAIDWSKFTGAKNAQEARGKMIELIRPDNYGKADGRWSLTELINERSAESQMAIRYVEGVDPAGKKADGGAMKTADGLEFTVKLRVLSRQACFEDKDGRGINTWDTTDTEPENWNNEWCPQVGDKPQTGDVVWVKGNQLTHDPATGKQLVKRYRLALKARVEAQLGRTIKPDVATHYHSKFTVDADGCITVPYLIAVQLLSRKGRGLVLPQFTEGAGRLKDKKVRQITNWLFEEVTPDEVVKKPKTEPATEPDPSDNPPIAEA